MGQSLINRQDNGLLDIRIGTALSAKEHEAGHAILDIDTKGTPVQLELVQVLGWLRRIRGVNIEPATISDLGADSAAVTYHPAIDRMMIRVFPGRKELTPFRGHEITLTIIADDGGRICGVRISVNKLEGDAIIARLR